MLSRKVKKSARQKTRQSQAIVAAIQPLEKRMLFTAYTIGSIESADPSAAKVTGVTLGTTAALVVTEIDSAPLTVTAGGVSKTFTNYVLFVNDGTGSAEVYASSSTQFGTYVPTVGDAITVAGTWYPTSGQIPELETLTAISKVSSGNAVPAPAVDTVSQVNVGTLPQTLAGYPVTLDNVTIGGYGTATTFTSTAATDTLSDSTGTMTFYQYASYSAPFSDLVGKPIPTGPVDITGYDSVFSGAAEFYPISLGVPTVTGVSPSTGPTAGGTTVTISGTGFTTETGVKFGSTAATSVVDTNVGGLNPDETITAVAPAGSLGTSTVTVTNYNGAATTGPTYTYTAAPVVTGVTPNYGTSAGGTTVTISGGNFTSGSTVSFGSTAATSVTYITTGPNAGDLTAVSPAEAANTTVNITVTTTSTSATSSVDDFSYFTTPTVTGLSPTSGPDLGGTSVTISGTGFVSGSTVAFGSSAATGVTYVNSTTLTAVAPKGTLGSTVDVEVTTPLGTSSPVTADQYSYTATTLAGIESLPSGTVVTTESDPVITAILSLPGTVNGYTYTNTAFLVNDGTGSIDVYGDNSFTPVVGEKVSITGTYAPYQALPEIESVTATTMISSGNTIPASYGPLSETVSAIDKTTIPESIAGYEVTLTNATISGISGNFGTSNLTGTITDSSSTTGMEFYYYVSSYSAANSFFYGDTIPTTPVTITGLVAVYGGTTPEFVPLSEPGTQDKFSFTDTATPPASTTAEPDGFSSVSRGTTISVTVTRSESTDAATVEYELINDSATGGTDFTSTGTTAATSYAGLIGTLSFATGVTTQTFTINTPSSPGDYGDKIFTIALAAPTGGTGYLPSVSGIPSVTVITDPSSKTTTSKIDENEVGTILASGEKVSSGAPVVSSLDIESNNTSSGTNTSYGLLTYDDTSGGDTADELDPAADTLETIDGIELETVALPQSFDVSGPLNVYIVSDTLKGTPYATSGSNGDGGTGTSGLTFNATADSTGGLGSQLGTKYLLGTIQYNALQVAGAYTPYNLTNLDPTGVGILASDVSALYPFTIAITPGNSTVSASFEGSVATGGYAVSPILRVDYATTLPSWVTAQVNTSTLISSAVWIQPTETLDVMGTSTGAAATIIADPDPTEAAASLPSIVDSTSGSVVMVTPTTNPIDIHLGGINLSGGSELVMSSVDASAVASGTNASNHSTDHNVLVLGTEGNAVAPTLLVDAASKLDLTDNDLIVHSAASDDSSGSGTSTELGIVQALAAVGRNVAPGGVYDGTWTGNELSSTAAATADSDAGYEQNILAVGLNSDLFLGTLSQWKVGTAIEQLASNDILVKYTYNGDLNYEGEVNGDSDAVFSTFYDGGASIQNDYLFGDLNGDARVDGNDDAIFSTVYGNGDAALGSTLPQL